MVDMLQSGLFLSRRGDGGLEPALGNAPQLFEQHLVLFFTDDVLLLGLEVLGGLLGLAQHSRYLFVLGLHGPDFLTAQRHDFVDFVGMALQLPLLHLLEEQVVRDRTSSYSHSLHL